MRKTKTEVVRCPWSLGVNEAYTAYHDEEWGVPVRDDRKQFEFLVLESAQAGLSWSTVLNKRAGTARRLPTSIPRKLRDSPTGASSVCWRTRASFAIVSRCGPRYATPRPS